MGLRPWSSAKADKGEQLIRYYGVYSNVGHPDGGGHVVAGRILWVSMGRTPEGNSYHPGIASLTLGRERAAKPGGCPEYPLFDGPPQVAVKFFYGRPLDHMP